MGYPADDNADDAALEAVEMLVDWLTSLDVETEVFVDSTVERDVGLLALTERFVDSTVESEVTLEVAPERLVDSTVPLDTALESDSDMSVD